VAAETGEDELLGGRVPVEVDGEAGPWAQPLADGDVGSAIREARRTRERLVHGNGVRHIIAARDEAWGELIG
jgi:hypothetical protein